jgi:hypothetical protein
MGRESKNRSTDQDNKPSRDYGETLDGFISGKPNECDNPCHAKRHPAQKTLFGLNVGWGMAAG